MFDIPDDFEHPERRAAIVSTLVEVIAAAVVYALTAAIVVGGVHPPLNGRTSGLVGL